MVTAFAGQSRHQEISKGATMFNPYQFQQAYQPYQPYQQPEPAFVEIDGRDSIPLLQVPPNQRRVYFDKRMERFYTVETDAVGAKSVQAAAAEGNASNLCIEWIFDVRYAQSGTAALSIRSASSTSVTHAMMVVERI